MSGKPKKSKNDTWTKEELSTVLNDKGHSSSKRPSEKRISSRSSKQALNERNEEEKPRRSREEKENRKLEKEKKRKKTAHDITEPVYSNSSTPVDDEEARRLEKARRREDRKSSRTSRHEVYEDPEKEARRKEKEERRRRREEEKQKLEDKEIRRREKEERRKTREERNLKEESLTEEETKRREKEERRRRREERKLEEGVLNEEEIKRMEKEERKRKRREEKLRDEAGVSERHSRSSLDKTNKHSKDKKKEQDRESRQRDKYRSSKSRMDDTDETEDRSKKKRNKDSDTPRKKTEIIIDHPSSESILHKNEEDDYNYDDEEFESYEDDFDDYEEDEAIKDATSDVRDIVQAMRHENQRVASARTTSARSERSALSSASERDRSTLGMTTINFFVARKTAAGSKVVKNMLKRRDDLSTVIQLDVVAFELFDLAPVTEYSFYIKSFGSQNSRQCSTQCNDDALEVETQTDPPEMVEKWTQHPQDGAFVCGGVYADSGSSHIESMLESMQEGSHRFSHFLDYVGGLTDAVFAEDNIYSGKKDREGSILSCCDSCLKFNTKLAYLQHRQILHVVFGEGGLIAVSHGLPKNKNVARLDTKGLVTVWKETNTDQPDKVLVCDALPVACCFVPKKKHLVFVGTEDGSVLVYDLNEPANLHVSREIEKKKITVLRSPTYTTGFQNKIHLSPIVHINPVGTFQFSNQVFSLDETGRICIWTVVNILNNVDDDLGLSPYGRVKLLKTTPVDVKTSKGTISQGLGIRATCAVCPDATVFYVGLESGAVLSLTRERRLKTYQSHSVGDVTSVAISKLNLSLLLVSYEDGTLALFQVKQESPVMTWSVAKNVLFCDWSNCRSSVFFALDSTNHLHVWDLMALDSAPIVSDIFEKKTRQLSLDIHSKKTTDLVVAYDSCSFEVHRIKSTFTDSVETDEADRMVSLLMSFG